VALLYRRSWKRNKAQLEKLRADYQGIYKVLRVPDDDQPKETLNKDVSQISTNRKFSTGLFCRKPAAAYFIWPVMFKRTGAARMRFVLFRGRRPNLRFGPSGSDDQVGQPEECVELMAVFGQPPVARFPMQKNILEDVKGVLHEGAD